MRFPLNRNKILGVILGSSIVLGIVLIKRTKDNKNKIFVYDKPGVEKRKIQICRNDPFFKDHLENGRPNGTKDLHTHIIEINKKNKSILVKYPGENIRSVSIKELFILRTPGFEKESVAMDKLEKGDCVIVANFYINNNLNLPPYSVYLPK
jgi:hypothetical protein